MIVFGQILKRLVISALLVLAVYSTAHSASKTASKSHVEATQDRLLYEKALKTERPTFVPLDDVSGITVPHHLVAADLIARGFYAASGRSYKRVIVVSPDHFRKNKNGMVLYSDPVDTIFGRLAIDNAAVDTIIEKAAAQLNLQIENVIEREHGLLTIMPFIAHFFPEAQIVPITMGIGTVEEQWHEAADLLDPLLDNDTLLVQSTDFSHYLPHGVAVLNDQQMLNVMTIAQPKFLRGLDQPGHLDSKAAMAIQMELQSTKRQRQVTIIANRNLADYSPQLTESTTSYIVAVFNRNAKAASRLRYQDQHLVYIGGDVLFGRFMRPFIAKEKALFVLKKEIGEIVNDAPLIINLEGVILPDDVAGLPANRHHMRADHAFPAMSALGVNAVSLANNHSHDLGDIGLEVMIQLLREHSIVSIEDGQVVDVGPLRILAVNHIKGRGNDGTGYTEPKEVSKHCFAEASAPVIVFAHWGSEYATSFDDETTELAETYARCGFSLVTGAHSHRVSPTLQPLNGNRAIGSFSLGNLAFDQTGDEAHGALLEVRVFGAKTISARLITLPNIYDAMQEAVSEKDG